MAVHRLLAPALRRLPPAVAAAALPRQRVGVPLYGPVAPLAGMDERVLDVAPLCAGVCARELESVVGAAEAVRERAGG